MSFAPFEVCCGLREEILWPTMSPKKMVTEDSAPRRKKDT